MARRRKVSPDVEVELETDEEEDVVEEALEQFMPTYERIEEYERQLEDLLNRVPANVRPHIWITVIQRRYLYALKRKKKRKKRSLRRRRKWRIKLE